MTKKNRETSVNVKKQFMRPGSARDVADPNEGHESAPPAGGLSEEFSPAEIAAFAAPVTDPYSDAAQAFAANEEPRPEDVRPVGMRPELAMGYGAQAGVDGAVTRSEGAQAAYDAADYEARDFENAMKAEAFRLQNLSRDTMVRVVVIDLETTGSEENGGSILEIAFRALAGAPVDRSLPLNEMHECPVYWAGAPETLHPAVQKMHTENGLFEVCRQNTTPTLAEVESWALRVLAAEFGNPEQGSLTLAGDSVHFDRAWMRVHMPRLAAMFSHHLLDLSAVKVFLACCGVDVVKGEPAHRAADDVNASIKRFHAMRRFVRLAVGENSRVYPVIDPADLATGDPDTTLEREQGGRP